MKKMTKWVEQRLSELRDSPSLNCMVMKSTVISLFRSAHASSSSLSLLYCSRRYVDSEK
jgi:hypothetical protein